MAQEAVPSNKGNLTFKYFKIERVQTGGNVAVQLNTDFKYLKLFKSGQRFAPDEPSSFSSLEFTFWDKQLAEKIALEWAAGIFRNHTKGDFLLDEYKVHFGRGNSQVGFSNTLSFHYTIFHQVKIGAYIQVGLGPQFTRWTSGDEILIPEKWGVRGWGIVGNTGLQLKTPRIWNRWSVAGFFAHHVSASRYQDFTVSSATNQQEETHYKGLHFANRNRRLNVSLSLTCDLLTKR